MSCLLRTRAVGAALALLLTSQVASAGPVSWDYTETLGGVSGGSFLYLSPYARPDATSPDDLRHATVYGIPTVPSPAGGYTGSAQFRVGGLTASGVAIHWDDDMTPLVGDDDGFRTDLTIRDAATGATGTFTATGTQSIVSDPMLFAFTLGLSISTGTDQEQVIGGTRYRVRFSTESDDMSVWVVADVSVGPAVATPEPATLVLASLGLAAVGIRVRRRMASVGA